MIVSEGGKGYLDLGEIPRSVEVSELYGPRAQLTLEQVLGSNLVILSSYEPQGVQ